jgi:hypothetical protein
VLPGCVAGMNVIPARKGRRPELTPEESMVEYVAEVMSIVKKCVIGLLLNVLIRRLGIRM